MIQKVINFHDVNKENIKEHSPNRSQILDRLYRILIIGDSGFGKQIHYLI